MSKDKSRTQPLPRDLVAALKAVVMKAGDPTRAAKSLGMPRGTIASALSGFPLREGTILLIRERLAAAEEAA